MPKEFTAPNTPVDPAGPTSTATPAPKWPPTCGTCKFFDSLTSWCRYTAPTAVVGANFRTTVAGDSQTPLWVTVEKDVDWCGQYLAAG